MEFLTTDKTTVESCLWQQSCKYGSTSRPLLSCLPRSSRQSWPAQVSCCFLKHLLEAMLEDPRHRIASHRMPAAGQCWSRVSRPQCCSIADGLRAHPSYWTANAVRIAPQCNAKPVLWASRCCIHWTQCLGLLALPRPRAKAFHAHTRRERTYLAQTRAEEGAVTSSNSSCPSVEGTPLRVR